MPGKSIGLLVLLAGCWLTAPGLDACQDRKQSEPPDKVKVTVVVILASEEGNQVDKRLKWIAAEVQKLNPNFKSFQLKSMISRSLAPNAKSEFMLVENQKAQVTVTQAADADNRVGLSIIAPNQGEIVYRTACGKFLPLVTRYQTKDKQRLILAIRVQPCLGD